MAENAAVAAELLLRKPHRTGASESPIEPTNSATLAALLIDFGTRVVIFTCLAQGSKGERSIAKGYMRRFCPALMSTASAAAAAGVAPSATAATLAVNLNGNISRELQFGDCLLHETFPVSVDAMGHDIAWVKVNEVECRHFELSAGEPQDAATTSKIVIPMSHAVHCPVCLARQEGVQVCPESNHWRAGVVVILEAHGHVLLTQRAAHMRSFPSVWVAPGGHIDNGESALQAAVRELEEEVGVQLQQEQLHPLAAWGSAFPVRYNPEVPPKRQHFVLYFHATMPSAALGGVAALPPLKLQASEVGAHAWVQAEQVQAMLQAETNTRSGNAPPDEALADSVTCCRVGDTRGDFQLSPADIVDHMAHGHVFALQQWMVNRAKS